MNNANKQHLNNGVPPRERLEPTPRPVVPNIVATLDGDAVLSPSAGVAIKLSPTTLITHIVLARTDYDQQDSCIAGLEELGYIHYETLLLGGNEILLRFRKNKQ